MMSINFELLINNLLKFLTSKLIKYNKLQKKERGKEKGEKSKIN